jgi:hypothetical protein
MPTMIHRLFDMTVRRQRADDFAASASNRRHGEGAGQ